MSRTYRKKNEPWWYKDKEDYDKASWGYKNKTYEAALACYNGDAMRNWNYSEVEFFETHFRAANRVALRKVLVSVDPIEVMFPLENEFIEWWW